MMRRQRYLLGELCMRIFTIIASMLLLISANPPSVTAEPLTPPKSFSTTPVVEMAQTKRGAPNSIPRRDQQGQPLRDDMLKVKLNSWTIGLAAGQLEGAPLRFATELARVLDDGDNMRVLPIVTRGIFDNIYDLLYLRGVDAAIVYGDVLEHFRANAKIGSLEQRVNYIMPLFPSEVHVFVRPEINKLEDLAGKRVNFNTKGTAAAFTGPIMFERLGIKVEPQFVPHPIALAEMRNDDKYAAVVFVSSKPLDAFVKPKWPEGFKFLPVPLTQSLEEYYVPAQLEPSDYPALIQDGGKIQTIAVPSVLAVFNWPGENERAKRIARFIDYLFERFPKLQSEPGYHPKWKDLNLAATVPGWKRYAPMQDKLAKLVNPRLGADKAAELSEQLERMLPGDKSAQQQLLRDLLSRHR
jgi:TRAP-type uncharacterized transport system substrate-binding protein